jgi:hypothetical protein
MNVMARATGRSGETQVERLVFNPAGYHLDYIQMNSRFLDKAGWAAEVNKMINAYGAPIPKEDVDTIASYLEQNYGKPADKQAAGSAAISAGASPRRR